MRKFSSGTQHPITIEKMVFHGWGLGKIDGLSIFVPHSLPGDELIIEILHRKKRHLMAKRIKIIKSSPYRSEKRCIHYPSCGGCQLMDVDYTHQLELKEAILRDCFEGQFPDLNEKFNTLVPSKNDRYYRNKMDFAFSKNENGIYLGLKERGKFDTVIHTNDCQLMSPETMNICTLLCEKLTQTQLSTWDYNTCKGSLRYASIRHSKKHDQYMLTLICGEPCQNKLTPILKEIQRHYPKLSSVYFLLNDAPGDNLHGLNPEHLDGPTQLYEGIGNQEFAISPLSFFQTNSLGANTLYQYTRDLAELKPTDTVLDLYCGTGTIGLSMAPFVKEVIGIEENSFATNDAVKNAKHNQIDNITFKTGRVKNILKFEEFDVDVVVVDPPRSGLVPKALRRTAALKAPRLVYVSCNPTTLCRDLKEFCNLGYEVEQIVGIDMFPNTYHIETVTRLNLVKNTIPAL